LVAPDAFIPFLVFESTIYMLGPMKTLPTALALILLIISARSQSAEPLGQTNLGLCLESPLDYQVIQRDSRSSGRLVIQGEIKSEPKGVVSADSMEVRLIGKSLHGDLPGEWQKLPCEPPIAAFRAELAVPAGGWYKLELRALRQGKEIARVSVEHVGVGEVFVIAGQSNSANYGEEKQATQTGLVAAFGGSAWQLAADPEPGAGGQKGSFMPAFGDAMVEQFKIPIGLVPMGIGSTSVREWLPAGVRFSNPPTITRNVVAIAPGEWAAKGKIFTHFVTCMKQFGPHGFRAVLWHQGESDARQAKPECTLSGDLYHQYLERLIRESRQQIGWDAPWFVAQASYHNPTDTGSPELRAAQKALWDVGVALEGPDTDTLTGDLREKNGQGIHLSGKGLQEHGRMWAGKVGPWLEMQLRSSEGAH
jgi:Carbohydrate esterase, sialic acid-specific acetylesterase